MAASSRFKSGDFATLAFAGGNGYRNSKYLEFIQIERQKSTTADRSIVENLPFSVENPLFLWKTATKLSAIALIPLIAFKKLEELRSQKPPSSFIPQPAVCWKYSLNISSFTSLLFQLQSIRYIL
ncbi:hypothetical protein [Microcoleus sp. herbarium2]|uniref:hypothetical protein n=1 Tax=Microcoleus sp. herbarium2 TaxID=3055433 RepID=UPI002FCF13C1